MARRPDCKPDAESERSISATILMGRQEGERAILPWSVTELAVRGLPERLAASTSARSPRADVAAPASDTRQSQSHCCDKGRRHSSDLGWHPVSAKARTTNSPTLNGWFIR